MMPRVTPADLEMLAARLIVDAIELEAALEDAAINDGRLSARVFNTQHRQIVVTRAPGRAAACGGAGMTLGASLAERLAALDVPHELVREAIALEEIAEDFRHLCHARGGLNLTDAAKVLEVKPKRLIGWLMGHGWIFREPKDQLAGMQSRLESGHLKQKIIRLCRVDGSETFGVQVFITAKGMAALAAEFRTERAQDERTLDYADPPRE